MGVTNGINQKVRLRGICSYIKNVCIMLLTLFLPTLLIGSTFEKMKVVGDAEGFAISLSADRDRGANVGEQ